MFAVYFFYDPIIVCVLAMSVLACAGYRRDICLYLSKLCRCALDSFVLFLLNVLRCQKHIRDNLKSKLVLDIS